MLSEMVRPLICFTDSSMVSTLSLKKMTFPNDKVLTIELSEKQISGRTISLSIDYEDVLSADSFNHILLEEE